MFPFGVDPDSELAAGYDFDDWEDYAGEPYDLWFGRAQRRAFDAFRTAVSIGYKGIKTYVKVMVEKIAHIARHNAWFCVPSLCTIIFS